MSGRKLVAWVKKMAQRHPGNVELGPLGGS
jgi:hypothetical protein